MDHQEKAFLVRRISHAWDFRYIDFQQDKMGVKFYDPSSEVLFRSDFVYQEAKEKAEINGLLTQEEALEVLKSEGKWDDSFELKEVQLTKSIKQLSDSLNKLKFQKIQQKKNKLALEEAEKALEEINKIKNQLNTSTIEHFAETSRRRWIIRQITEVQHIDASLFLDNERFVDKCIYEYYVNSMPKMTEIREISRTEPWRMYWLLSKNNSTSIFPSSAVEMTELQYLLTMWSRVYDFAFESDNKPPKDVISDDVKFDAWYDSEMDRLEQEEKKSQANNGNWSKGQEVFIPADKEGAKEVYALNNQQNRSKIANKLKHIKEQGPTTEANLPDVKRELIMQANRQNSDAVMQRSKGK